MSMKKGIHPKWHHDCVVTCSCGNKFTTGSIKESMKIDICNKCHPFFTGEMKFVDQQGRVDKFMKKMQIAKQKQQATKQNKSNKKTSTKTDDSQDKTYRDILREQRSKISKTSKDSKKK